MLRKPHKPFKRAVRLPRSKQPHESNKEFARRLLFDRGSQIIIGLLFVFLGSGIGIYDQGTEGGHSEFAMFRLFPQKSEARRLLANKTRIKKIYPTVAPKIQAVLDDMGNNGYRPVIDGQVHRTPAEQLALYRRGRTKVTYSYHTVTGRNGTPESLAADLPDMDKGWNAPRVYWITLARCAYVHGLNSGIYFGVKGKNRTNLESAIKTRNFGYKGPIGWDPSHIETKDVTLGQARRGVRPR